MLPCLRAVARRREATLSMLRSVLSVLVLTTLCGLGGAMDLMGALSGLTLQVE